jgi:hypothetical protein
MSSSPKVQQEWPSIGLLWVIRHFGSLPNSSRSDYTSVYWLTAPRDARRMFREAQTKPMPPVSDS